MKVNKKLLCILTLVGFMVFSISWYNKNNNYEYRYTSSKLKNTDEDTKSDTKPDKDTYEDTNVIVKIGKVSNSSDEDIKDVNVRSGPGTSYSKIGKLSNGSKVTIVDQSSDWCKIEYNNSYGYVFSDSLKIGYYIGDTPIVNKKYNLSSNYTYLDNKELYDEATSNFSKMVADAEKEGLTIETLNRYRSYEHQNFIYNYYEARCEDVESFSAKPGFSEHQTGLAYDVGNSDPNTKANISFEQTKEYNWLKNNSYKYGFILRYPKGKTAITGYTFEPWHYRYVGTELSYKVYESGLTLEEYFGI